DIIKICFKQEDRGCLHLKKTMTVVDIRSFDKYRKNYGEFFEDQITYADLILLSHQEEEPQKIQSVRDKIEEMNPEARIEADFWESIPASVFRHGPRNSSIFKLELETAVSMKPVKIRGLREQSGKAGFIRRHFAREVFSSVTIEWERPLTEKQLRKKVLRVVKQAEGEILRGKGIVPDGLQGLVFHYLPGSLSIEPVTAAGNQVCFIGTGLDEQQIRTLFSEETI
ncbi:MAG: GTP-binding protein, partial [Clostridiales bacterium]|nr:GTP-binding protein [Clostridiales bacterium]